MTAPVHSLTITSSCSTAGKQVRILLQPGSHIGVDERFGLLPVAEPRIRPSFRLLIRPPPAVRCSRKILFHQCRQRPLVNSPPDKLESLSGGPLRAIDDLAVLVRHPALDDGDGEDEQIVQRGFSFRANGKRRPGEWLTRAFLADSFIRIFEKLRLTTDFCLKILLPFHGQKFNFFTDRRKIEGIGTQDGEWKVEENEVLQCLILIFQSTFQFKSLLTCVIIIVNKPSAENTRPYNWLGRGYPL